MNDIIKIDPKVISTLTETEAKEIEVAFSPMLKKMAEKEEEYNEIITERSKTKEPTKELCLKAKKLRLELVSIRTGTAKIHKTVKAYYRKMGLAIDGWKNAQVAAGGEKEDNLKQIEDYRINIEKEKAEKRAIERTAELEKYEADYIPLNIGEMDQPVWENYLAGVKAHWQQVKDAEEKAEAKRIEDERRETLFLEAGYGRGFQVFKYGDSEYDIEEIHSSTETEFSTILEEAKKAATEYDQEQNRIKKENDKLKRDEAKKEKARIKQLDTRKEKAAEFLKEKGFILSEDQAGYEHPETHIFIWVSDFCDLETDKELELFKVETESSIKEAVKAQEQQKKDEEAKKLAAAPDKEKILAYMKELCIYTADRPEVNSKKGKSILDGITDAIAELDLTVTEEVEKI